MCVHTYVRMYICMYVRECMYAYVCMFRHYTYETIHKVVTYFFEILALILDTFALSVRQFLNIVREEKFRLVLKLNMR